MKENEVKLIKILMLLLFIIIMILLTIRLIPIFKNLSTEEGRLGFKDEIESLGAEGVLIILGLMIVQIFLPILPGEPVEVLARNVIWTIKWFTNSNAWSIYKYYYYFLCS